MPGTLNGRQALTSRKRSRCRRKTRACELRAEGRSLEDVAIELGYAGKSGAFRAIRRGMARTLEPATELRAQTNATLTLLIDEAMDVAMDRQAPDRWQAFAALVQLLNRQAKLMGLDAPPRRALGVLDGEVLATLMAKMERELRSLGVDPATA